MKKVLDVGQCQMDHGSLKWLIEDRFEAQVIQAHDAEQALAQLRAGAYDLVLVNRKLDADATDGLEIIQAMKADPQLAAVPVMLVSNYPEVQRQAVEAGAEPGFGKSEMREPRTLARLEKFLG
jgi:CheY-like chemotaxis protein